MQVGSALVGTSFLPTDGNSDRTPSDDVQLEYKPLF